MPLLDIFFPSHRWTGTWIFWVLVAAVLTATPEGGWAQTGDQGSHGNRIPFRQASLFLSGGNVPWIAFARDVGPGHTNLKAFEERFRRISASGGNSMRLWLHTNGVHTPEWGADSTVVGPGRGTISDLRHILDRAWEQKVGLILCLWSFDMMREEGVDWPIDRNEALLRDPALTKTYVENALIPMVEAVGDHPALLAWEIINEPEGMSHRFGWEFTRHVSMADIQRFINQTAASIRRTDPDALVTTGAWSFMTVSDAVRDPLRKRRSVEALSPSALESVRAELSRRYRHEFTRSEVKGVYARRPDPQKRRNYYRDDRLVEAGGHPRGVLDFYSVHYYEWMGKTFSPFHVDANEWRLKKPIVIAEFAMKETFGVPSTALYPALYHNKYAGALGWSFDDRTAARRIEDNVETLFRRHPGAVSLDVSEQGALGSPAASLYPPSPNPVTGETTLIFDMHAPGFVRLSVFDSMGRRVRVLVDGWKGEGRHRLRLHGENLQSGLYLLRLRAAEGTYTRRMVVVK